MHVSGSVNSSGPLPNGTDLKIMNLSEAEVFVNYCGGVGFGRCCRNIIFSIQVFIFMMGRGDKEDVSRCQCT